MKLNKEYYPTPKELALKMAAEMDRWKDRIETVLEPSAGDGNLIDAIGGHFRQSYNREFQVDFCEIDESLSAVCMDRFRDDRKYELLEEIRSIKCWYSHEEGRTIYPSKEDEERKNALEYLKDVLDKLKVRCVGDDFLQFETYKKYDCIIMNPPFSNGAEHLLKAIKLQKRHGGLIICLLNAETVRNPYTQQRKALMELLQENDAELEFIKNGFADADRETDVETVLITVYIQGESSKKLILDDLEKAGNMDEGDVEYFLSAGEGTIGQLLEQFNYEVKATLSLINEYNQLKPYIMNAKTYPGEEQYLTPLLELKLSDGSRFTVNEYMKKVRLKYWRALFHNKEFTGRLTSQLYETFMSAVNDMADYDFNMFNIKQVMKRMAAEMEASYDETIMALFDKLSVVHAYNGTPDDQNVHYYNGWKTNKSWKINDSKVIIPCYGTFGNWSYNSGFDPREAYGILSDIEKTLNYLDGGETESDIDLASVLEMYYRRDVVRNVSLKYFDVTFYKKGTCHIKWKNKRLVEKLNIYGSRKKAWLPPGYGTKTYDEMGPEEQQVINEFQGKEAYEQVLCQKDYYLPDNSFSLPMIAG